MGALVLGQALTGPGSGSLRSQEERKPPNVWRREAGEEGPHDSPQRNPNARFQVGIWFLVARKDQAGWRLTPKIATGAFAPLTPKPSPSMQRSTVTPALPMVHPDISTAWESHLQPCSQFWNIPWSWAPKARRHMGKNQSNSAGKCGLHQHLTTWGFLSHDRVQRLGLRFGGQAGGDTGRK